MDESHNKPAIKAYNMEESSNFKYFLGIYAWRWNISRKAQKDNGYIWRKGDVITRENMGNFGGTGNVGSSYVSVYCIIY